MIESQTYSYVTDPFSCISVCMAVKPPNTDINTSIPPYASMRVYEAVLEYLRLKTNASRRDVDKMGLVNAHIVVDSLSDDELKQECSLDDPHTFLQQNLGASAEELITGLSGVDGEERLALLDDGAESSELPKNCSIPFAFAIDGKVNDAADVMKYLLDRGIASEHADGDQFKQYEEQFGQEGDQYTQQPSEGELVIKAIEEPSEPVQAVIGGVINWAEDSFSGQKLLQLEVPVGATRIAASGDTKLNIDRSIDQVLQKKRRQRASHLNRRLLGKQVHELLLGVLNPTLFC